MAEDKKGFILYADQKELFDQLPNDKAGELIKHIFSYVNDENPETDDLILKLAFIPIKQQLKRDLVKYEDKRTGQSNAGKEGNLKRWNLDLYCKYKSGKITLDEALSIANNRKVSPPDKSESPPIAKIAVTDTVTDSVTVTDNDTVKVIKNNIEDRKLKFATTLNPFISTYGKPMLNDFLEYWTEPNKSNTKFRQELQRTWSLERRIKNWAKNDKNFNNGTGKPTRTEQNKRDSDASTKQILDELQEEIDQNQTSGPDSV